MTVITDVCDAGTCGAGGGLWGLTTDEDYMLGPTINNTLHINTNMELVKMLQTRQSQPPTLCSCLSHVSVSDNAISNKLNIISTSIWTMGLPYSILFSI